MCVRYGAVESKGFPLIFFIVWVFFVDCLSDIVIASDYKE